MCGDTGCSQTCVNMAILMQHLQGFQYIPRHILDFLPGKSFFPRPVSRHHQDTSEL